MSYAPQVNANTLQLFLGVCATGRATASSTTLDLVSFGTIYNPQPGITFLPSDVGMPIAIVGGGPVDPLMPAPYFVQGALFHTTIAAYVSPTQVTLAAAPTTGIFNTGFATVILYRPCPIASDVAAVPTAFQWSSSIAPGTADTLQFSVLNSFAGNNNPYIDRFGAIKRGQPVYLKSSVTGDVFGGYIDTLTTSSQPGLPGTPYCWSATCASWQGLAKRRVVPPAIPQVLTAVDGDVAFRTIVLDYLSDDGVSVTAPSGLPTITIACAVGANIGQLLDQVVSLLSTATTAYYWTSDPWRNFILATRAATAAPWNVSDGSDLFAGSSPYLQSIVVSGNQLANNVYFIGSSTLLNALNATFVGDGTTVVFNTPLDVGSAPTITKNSVAQTVGVLGVDSGKDWYWSQGSTAITQDAAGPILTAADTLVISYLTATPAVAMAPNVGSLQQLQAIEGTSANYDYTSSITQPILPADLLALANGYEAEYGEPATTCQFYTLRPGLATGQLQTIVLPDAGIPSASYLIATLQMTILNQVIVYQYTAFGGANIGNAITALTQFINRNQATLNILTPTVPITAAQAAGVIAGQNVTGNSSGGSPLAFPNPVTAGNLLVISAERNSSLGNPPTVTDTQGLTWTQAIFGGSGGGFPNQISILFAFAAVSGPEAIHCDSAEFFSIMEFSGVSQTIPVAIAGVQANTAPTVTLPAADLLVVTGMAGVPATPTVTSPEVLLGFHADTTQPGEAMAYELAGAAGSFTSSLASAGSGPTSIWATVAFNPKLMTTPPAQTINVQGNGGLSVTTKGDLQGFSAAPARVPVGVDGDVLTADSTQALGLKWAVPSSGGAGAVLLEEHTVSSAADLEFVTRNAAGQSGATFQADFDDYEIRLTNIIPATNGQSLTLQVSVNGGSTWQAGTDYAWVRYLAVAGGAGSNGSNSDASVQIYASQASAAAGVCGSIKISSPLSTAVAKLFTGLLTGFDTIDASMGISMIAGAWQPGSPAAINACRLIFGSGNIASGTARIYGLSK